MTDSPGILGVGPPSLAINPFPQLIQNLVNLKLIDSYVFSLYLSNEENADSRIVFGGIDSKYIQPG